MARQNKRISRKEQYLKFYQSSVEVSEKEIEIFDLLLMRYGSGIDYVLSLPFCDGIKLVNKAFEERAKEKAWDLYKNIYPHMTEQTYLSFDEFYKPKIKIENEDKSEEKILNEVKNTLNNLRRGGDDNRTI